MSYPLHGRRYYLAASMGWYVVALVGGTPVEYTADWLQGKRFPRRWMAELAAGTVVHGAVICCILDADDKPRVVTRDAVEPIPGRFLASPFTAQFGLL